MALHDGTLSLSARAEWPVTPMPIDHLFRSLAEVQKSRAIAVVLSGGGTDGALGCQAIKAEGGIAFAQDEKSARHDSMPRAAAGDGHIDYVLPPREIARQLMRLVRHPYARAEEATHQALPEAGAEVDQIIGLLRSGTAVDFSNYKRSTIRRRIQRRMALRGVEDVRDYLKVLHDDPAEVRALYQDFLIRVTRFFRDPGAFEALKEKVFPALLRDRAADHPIRVWVAGCSTGEEVYSLAICLLEFLGSRADSVPVKILATDVNDNALQKARAGLYLDNIEIDVPPDRLRRFFLRVDGHYQINKSVRDLCVFSRHNMGSDPPFSHLDLVSCRNVLIYMDLSLQKRILPIFHYALKPDRFLFLGASESIGNFADLFAAVDARHRLFVKKAAARPVHLDFGTYISSRGDHRPAPPEGAPVLWSGLDVQREADRLILSRFAPVGVVIDEALNVLQFRGRTGAYLEPAPGLASLDLLKMLREGLLVEVRNAVNQAKTENASVRRENLRLIEKDRTRLVNVEVTPFKVPPAGVRCFLVLFSEAQAVAPEGPPAAQPPAQAAASEHQVAQLQQELAALREYLQSIIEEYEVTNEELKAASEEILSSNEELQSTNEELQTAKEELQSANEELATVNEELRHRNLELAQLNNDLVNLLGGINIPIVMVSRDLRVRRMTPPAEKVLNLIPTDVGRPISDIKPNVDIPDLPRLIARVIDTLTPHESDVRDSQGRWWSLRIRPYVTLENKIDGASITLVDVDDLKRSLEQLKRGQPPASGGDGEPRISGGQPDGP